MFSMNRNKNEEKMFFKIPLKKKRFVWIDEVKRELSLKNKSLSATTTENRYRVMSHVRKESLRLPQKPQEKILANARKISPLRDCRPTLFFLKIGLMCDALCDSKRKSFNFYRQSFLLTRVKPKTTGQK